MKNAEPRDTQLARLQKRALDSIHAGTQWLTAQQLDELRTGLDAPGAGLASQWQAGGKLFSIQIDGREVFPRYALGDDLEPLPAIQDVLKVFEGWSARATAGWFESRSSFLAGRRPRELIAADAARVLSAAQDLVMHLSQ